MTASPNIWFRYRVTPRGRLTWPVNAMGWMSLLAITILPTLVFVGAAQALHIRSVWAGIAYLVLAIPAMAFVLTKLFQARGQQA